MGRIFGRIGLILFPVIVVIGLIRVFVKGPDVVAFPTWPELVAGFSNFPVIPQMWQFATDALNDVFSVDVTSPTAWFDVWLTPFKFLGSIVTYIATIVATPVMAIYWLFTF